MILGIDEVGRGCWAGPLVMGAVVLGDASIEGLTDSKVLSAKKRQMLAEQIHQKALAVGLGWVSAAEVDTLGLAAALPLACRRSLEVVDALGVAYHEIIIDGTINFLRDTKKSPYVTTMKKADLLIASVSAASIVAKVARDNYMVQQDGKFPGYGFDTHVGYGTAYHRQAIEQLGVCELHRLSIAPLKKYQVSQPSQTVVQSQNTTKQIGDRAETVVADELEKRGHRIIARNWRTRFCEIDIISIYEDTVCFIEVKYRKNATFGDGLAAITAKKQRQMRFAVEVFFAKYPELSDHQAVLMAASVAGNPPFAQQIITL